MYFIFDLETIPDFDFVRKVLNDYDSDNETLLEIASEELARNNQASSLQCIIEWFHGLVYGLKIMVSLNRKCRGMVRTKKKAYLKYLMP